MFKSKFVKNNFIFMTGTLLSGLLGYAFHFVVSRQISIAQYGELQSLLSAFVIFGVFNSALSYFVIRHTSVFAAHDDREALKSFVDYVSPKIFWFTLLLLLCLFVASPLLASLLHFSSYIGFFAISLSTFFLTLTVIWSEILRGWEDFFLLSAVGIATTFVKFGTGSVISFFSQKAAIISFSILFSSLVGWYLAKYWCRKKISGTCTHESEWRDKYFSQTNIRKTAIHIFFFSLTLILVSNLDVILVKYFSSPEMAGHYGAFALLGKIVLWLAIPVTSVALPEACTDGHLGKRLDKKSLLKSYGLMTLIGLLAILAYYLAPNIIVNLFFGKKYIIETHILWLFGLMSFLLALLTFEANLSFAKQDFRVVYILAATLILMIVSVTVYRANLQEIVLSFSFSYLLGYASITILNLLSERRRTQAEIL
jgi:O-antigen/teichoic acid export membrane protein